MLLQAVVGQPSEPSTTCGIGVSFFKDALNKKNNTRNIYRFYANKEVTKNNR
jgi:hypothetical protein